MIIQRLREKVGSTRLWRLPQISERTATFGQNWDDAERFKTAIAQGLVHAPLHQLARDELLYLQQRDRRVDHPTSGPVRTSDLADCMFAVVAHFLGATNGYEQQLGSFHLGATSLNALRSSGNPQDKAVFDSLHSFGQRPPDPHRGNPARSRNGGR